MAKFEELRVWQKAVDLAVEVYRLLEPVRDFGFKDQISRAAVSISSNIAEGHERVSKKDAVNFFRYAKGSAGEVRSQVHVGRRLGYFSLDSATLLVRHCEDVSRMLSALMRANRC